jgi:uncharacterized protein (UPF0332 family)
MMPEAAYYLGKARGDLHEAGKIAAIGLAAAPARSAYYAAFHAAQAFIIDRTGKVAKTHSGVQSEFSRLARETSKIDTALPAFLAKAYKYKQVADYGVGPGAVVTVAEADDAITSAAHFVACMTALLG